MEMFEGYLFARVYRVGSKSEGPEYFLQMPSGSELMVVKKVQPWMKDPELHPLLCSWVMIKGEFRAAGEIAYSNVEQRIGVVGEGIVEPVEVKVVVQEDPIWIDKTPGPGPRPHRALVVHVMVTNTLDISLWDASSSSVPINVVMIDPDGKQVGVYPDKVIWGVLPSVILPVHLPPRQPVLYYAILLLDPAKFKVEGMYQVQGEYCPRNIKDVVSVEVKFAY